AQQTSSIEQIRYLTPELAVMDGLWTVTGARDDAGKELPPINGRGLEIAQKRDGRWWFVSTREMIIYKGEQRRHVVYLQQLGKRINDLKSQSPIVRIGVIALVAVLAAVIAAVVQQALFGRTQIVATFVAVLVTLLVIARRLK